MGDSCSDWDGDSATATGSSAGGAWGIGGGSSNASSALRDACALAAGMKTSGLGNSSYGDSTFLLTSIGMGSSGRCSPDDGKRGASPGPGNGSAIGAAKLLLSWAAMSSSLQILS